MTEAEWFACGDPIDMLLVSPGKNASDRKVRLFLCGCCRRVWDFLSPENRAAVEVAERFANGLATVDELRATEGRSRMYRDDDDEEPLPEDQPPSYWCDVAAWKVTGERVIVRVGDVCDATRRVAGDRSGEWEEVVQARLLRCALGNPFREVPFDPAWRTPAVLALAKAIDADRTFDRVTRLADMLAGAGCEQQDVLSHLRGPGPHARGCWIIDSLVRAGD